MLYGDEDYYSLLTILPLCDHISLGHIYTYLNTLLYVPFSVISNFCLHI